MKVALVHDWITGMRGGERCLSTFLKIYPDADIFTMLHVPGATTATIDDRVKQTSFLQNFPSVSKYYRLLLPLYPKAISGFDFSEYELVISLSHAAAKNISLNPGTTHVSYCFTPMRYVWDQSYNYFGKATPLLWPLIKGLRNWDREASIGVNQFVAISRFVAARIRCFYKRDAKVIYPPVDVSWIEKVNRWRRGSAFLYAGALAPYKKVDRIIDAFNELEEDLWIAGSGQDEKRLRARAGKHIKFLGSVSDKELGGLYKQCRALIFAGTEDFGMVPIECLGAGRPVIGIYDGALKESLGGLKPWEDLAQNSKLDVNSASGVFIQKKPGREVQSLIASVRYFLERESDFRPESCIRQAERFSPQRFYDDWFYLMDQMGLGHAAADYADRYIEERLIGNA